MIRLSAKQFSGMGKPAKLNARVGLREQAVSAQINQWLTLKGWQCHRTPSDKVRTAAGHWFQFYPEGHADYLCTRPLNDGGRCEVFFREDKAQNGETQKKRKVAQAAWAEHMRNGGYIVWTCPDKCADPYAEFTNWYRTNWEY